MKNFIACLLALVVPCLAHTAFAQPPETDFYPDSIRVELPKEKVLVIFEMRRFENDFRVIQNFPAKFQDLIGHVVKSLPTNFRETDPKKITISLKPEEKDLVIQAGAAGHFYKEKGE